MVVIISISLTKNNVEKLLMCLKAICTYRNFKIDRFPRSHTSKSSSVNPKLSI